MTNREPCRTDFRSKAPHRERASEVRHERRTRQGKTSGVPENYVLVKIEPAHLVFITSRSRIAGQPLHSSISIRR
jgi:hypothetical protein